MDFADDKFGTVAGDPIFNNFFFAFTYDGGENWLAGSSTVKAINISQGEAFFAASGTNIRSFKRKRTQCTFITQQVVQNQDFLALDLKILVSFQSFKVKKQQAQIH